MEPVVSNLSWLSWIIFGALAGWIASILTGNNSRMGCFSNIIVGIVGAFLGGWIYSLITGHTLFGSRCEVPEAQQKDGTNYACPIFLLPFIMPLHLADTLRRDLQRQSWAGNIRNVLIYTATSSSNIIPQINDIYRSLDQAANKPASECESSCEYCGPKAK